MGIDGKIRMESTHKSYERSRHSEGEVEVGQERGGVPMWLIKSTREKNLRKKKNMPLKQTFLKF